MNDVTEYWAVLCIGFCVYLSFFMIIVFGFNYIYRKIADYEIVILIPVALDIMFILYYNMHIGINTFENLLVYLIASHFPFAAVSFCKDMLKARTTHLRIIKFIILGLSALLYMFAIGNIIFDLPDFATLFSRLCHGYRN